LERQGIQYHDGRVTMDNGVLSAVFTNAQTLMEQQFPNHLFRWTEIRNNRTWGICPNPNHQETRPSFNIFVRESTMAYYCFGCGMSGTIDNITVPYHGMAGAREGSKTTMQITREYNEAFKPFMIAPSSQMKDKAYAYLKGRGITDQDILTYNIGFCGVQGKYLGFVGFPFRDMDNHIQFFCGRSTMGGFLRYLFPENTDKKEIVNHYLGPDCERVVLVEGVFDAIQVNKAGFTVIPLFGKYIAKAHIKFITDAEFDEVVVFLDQDARKDSLKIQATLVKLGFKAKVALTTKKDPGEMSLVEIQQQITGQGISFFDTMRLNLGTEPSYNEEDWE